jgi:tight adherence protein C
VYAIAVFALVTVTVGGVAALVGGLLRPAVAGADAAEYLQSLDYDEPFADEFEQKLAEPFLARVVRPLGGHALDAITRLTPSGYLDTIHKKLLLAGLLSTLRAEEFVVGQAAFFGVMTLADLAYVVFGNPSTQKGILLLVLMPSVAVMLPHAWLNRKVAERKFALLRDLPDTLDLLAISVEAGLGFEGAIEVVINHFHSPLADEFSRTLKEMELGLPRRDAFQNLKRRTEVPELSNFVLAITQADSLGIPIGRVLKTQAAEMRSKRRQWARERAGKLPVKILFPLVGFIFPAILVVLLGPAGSSITKALH